MRPLLPLLVISFLGCAPSKRNYDEGSSAGSGGSAANIGGSGGNGTDGLGGDSSRTDAPRVVSITPSNGASGVTADATIEIAFDRVMDPDSVAAALSITSFTPDDLELSWNANHTIVTITPNDGFLYASGTERDKVTPRTYTVALERTARDKDGHILDTATSVKFTTLRRISQTLSPVAVLDYDTFSSYQESPPRPCPTESGNTKVGWWSGAASGGSHYTYVEYDASELGDEVRLVESAIFNGEQVDPDENFYPARVVRLVQLEHGPVDVAHNSMVQVEALGTLAVDAISHPSLDITSAFWTSWSAGNAQQLFRMYRGNSDTGGPLLGAFTNFTCAGFSLVVTYLIP